MVFRHATDLGHALPEFVEEVGRRVLDSAFTVHRHLGPGLFESVDKLSLADELAARGSLVKLEAPVHIAYKGRPMGAASRVDIEVDRAVLVEVKSVETLLPVHRLQIQTDLRLAERPLGFLVNFNEARLKHGLERFVWTPSGASLSSARMDEPPDP